MKILATARVLVAASDPARGAEICSSLSALGMLRVESTVSLARAQEIVCERPVDLCLLEASLLSDQGTESGLRTNPLPGRHIPAVVLNEGDTRWKQRQVAALGYRGTIDGRLTPRLLYRQIGSMLQRIRREDRAAGSGMIKGSGEVERPQLAVAMRNRGD